MWVKPDRRIVSHNFRPAASRRSLTRISRKIRRWAPHHRSDKSLAELAEMWINYYSHFYRTQLRPSPQRIDAYVIRWARRKYKRMRPQTKCQRLVCATPPRQPNPLCMLAAMSWQRPNIWSRVTREYHARFWERPGVKFFRATRLSPKCRDVLLYSGGARARSLFADGIRVLRHAPGGTPTYFLKLRLKAASDS
jgi:hypothetical protein